MAGIRSRLTQPLPEDPPLDLTSQTLALGIVWYLVFVFSITCHEAAHAFAAHRLGDSTAYHAGQVSLNPWPHIRREPFGMVLMPLLTFAISRQMLGWASAPYDPGWALRYPRKAALMAAAGPIANLILTVLAGIGLRVGLSTGAFVPELSSFSQLVGAAQPGAFEGVATALSIAFVLNLLLFVFNLIPVPPLDGSGVIQLVMSEDLARRYRTFLWEQPMIAWAGLLLAWKLFDPVFRPILGFALTLVFGGLG